MLAELTAALKDVKFGEKESYTGQLKSILSNENIFGIDLYKAGIGEKIEELFVKENRRPGRSAQDLERKSDRLNKSKTKPEEKHENSSGLIFLNPLTEYKQSVTLKMRKAKSFFIK